MKAKKTVPKHRVRLYGIKFYLTKHVLLLLLGSGLHQLVECHSPNFPRLDLLLLDRLLFFDNKLSLTADKTVVVLEWFILAGQDSMGSCVYKPQMIKFATLQHKTHSKVTLICPMDLKISTGRDVINESSQC